MQGQYWPSFTSRSYGRVGKNRLYSSSPGCCAVFRTRRRNARLLVAHHHNSSREYSYMCNSYDEPITLIRWGIRSLYVLLFLSCMIVMGKWTEPITLAFLGSVFCLILPILFLPEIERYPKALTITENPIASDVV